MKFNGIEHFDHFDGETIFWGALSDPPQEIQDAARKIDGDNYRGDCFEICAHYDVKTGKTDIVTEAEPSSGEKLNIYYVDNEGDKHWFKAELPEDFVKQLFDACGRITTGRDTVQGYEVKAAILFENGRGVALAENPKAPQPFVTWMFTQDQHGRRDYEWGHYFGDGDRAAHDFKTRADDYRRSYGVREVKRPIAEQLKEAAKLAEADRGRSTQKKSAPDRGDR